MIFREIILIPISKMRMKIKVNKVKMIKMNRLKMTIKKFKIKRLKMVKKLTWDLREVINQ